MVRPATKEVLEMAAKEELPRHIYCDGKYELLEFKADKMPIGIYTADAQSFTNNEMILNKRDTIYIFSDGYADQFGGPHGKKFKYKSFKELLLSIQDKKMEEQEVILNDTMEAWKEGYDQIDDILVIGVRL
ncbi:MAG: SpoIIE family protein phosphatase [Bacteroidetes bacterium]|nr:SpoIIE family protein phosphatase [Bacteroidota bacterium]